MNHSEATGHDEMTNRVFWMMNDTHSIYPISLAWHGSTRRQYLRPRLELVLSAFYGTVFCKNLALWGSMRKITIQLYRMGSFVVHHVLLSHNNDWKHDPYHFHPKPLFKKIEFATFVEGFRIQCLVFPVWWCYQFC